MSITLTVTAFAISPMKTGMANLIFRAAVKAPDRAGPARLCEGRRARADGCYQRRTGGGMLPLRSFLARARDAETIASAAGCAVA